MAWNNIKIEQGVKTYNLTEKQYMQMTEEILAATTIIDNLEMKLGEVITILRALAAANKCMVETTDAAVEGGMNINMNHDYFTEIEPSKDTQMTTTPTSGGADLPEARLFTKKPVTIAAIQWTGHNLREVITFTDGPPDTRTTHAGMAWETYTDLVARDGLKIYTLEGKMLASPGDWIIRGVKGELYPCKPDIFEATYSPAAQPASQPSPAAQGGAAFSGSSLRCQHCIDRHDGIYGSWAAPCPYHDDDGKPRTAAATNLLAKFNL